MNQADDDTPRYPIPDTPLQRQMAIGHRRRTGHELTGYLRRGQIMNRNYTTDNDGSPARPATRGYSRTEELPYVLGEGTVRRYAQEIANDIIADVRSVHGPVVWVTGNSYVPAFRSFPAAERVWNAENNYLGDLFPLLVETVEDHLARENVYLGSPDYDNALYAVDLRRWQWKDDDGHETDDINDDWEPVVE